MKNEAYNENLINYHIITIDKHFVYNYHYYYKIDKEKTIDYTIDDHITIIIYKTVNLDLIITKSF